MPRNSSGTYSLPAGNPVVTATIIQSSWANNTCSDLASAMTDSLSRSGDGGMLAPFELLAGTQALPALTWTLDTTSGWYRSGAGDYRFSVLAVDKLQLTADGMKTADGTFALPGMGFIADPNTGLYRIAADTIGITTGGVLRLTISDTAITFALPVTLTLANPVFTGVMLGGNGAVGGPAYSFSADPTTGIYRPAASTVSVATAGVQAVRITANQQLLVADGTVALPTLGFISDPDSGFYVLGANSIGLSLGNALVVSFLTSQIQTVNGTAPLPAYTFISDPDTGMYRLGGNQIGFAASGAHVVEISTNTIQGNGTAFSYYWLCSGSGADGGYWRFIVAATSLQLQTRTDANGGGDVALNFARTAASTALTNVTLGGTNWRFPDGLVTLPGINFNSDTNTGFYRDTADQIAIALGGVTFGQIAQGSFTPTWTGFSAAPSGDCTWQRVGNLITLFFPTGTGTSNATTMTITNLPAAIRPSAATSVVAFVMDLGVAQVGRISISAAGVMTFGATTAGAGGFTNSGTKGIPPTVHQYYLG